MIEFWTTEIRLGRQDLPDKIRTRRPPLDDLHAKILAVSDKSPFELADLIAERLPIAATIVLRHLHDSIGFKSFHLHSVSHALTEDLHEKRKEHARAMSTFLHAAEHNGWHHLVTGDES
jgi:hypothetical protein